VLGAAVALVVILAKSGKDDAKGADSAAKPVATGSALSPPSPPVIVTDKPRGESVPTPITDPSRDYSLGGAHVHDHRSGEQKPLDVPPNIHPSESRQLPSNLTYDISEKVKAVMADCVASLPKEGRGSKPRVEGQVVVAIKDKTMSVTSSTIQLRDLEGLGAAADTAQQCIQSHAVGLSSPAAGEADLDAYTINLSLRVP
jgi:hypothetical protein